MTNKQPIKMNNLHRMREELNVILLKSKEFYSVVVSEDSLKRCAKLTFEVFRYPSIAVDFISRIHYAGHSKLELQTDKS